MAIFNTVYGGEYHLPGTYQKVEYIQSSGECRIDTGYSPSGSYLGIQIKFKYNSFSYSGSGADTPGVYGYVASNYCLMVKATSNGKLEVGNGQKSIYGPTVATNTDYECDITASNGTQTAIINGETYSGVCGSSLSTGPIQIFGWQTGSNTYSRYATDMTLYYMKIYSSAGTLERDLIPCYRKSDGVIGMYDLVGKQFYTNAGSGTFTKGPDVN